MTVAEVSGQLQRTFTPMDDHRGSAAYRSRLVGSLFEKFFAEHADRVPAPTAVGVGV